jgi:hypothetical protein
LEVINGGVLSDIGGEVRILVEESRDVKEGLDIRVEILMPAESLILINVKG